MTSVVDSLLPGRRQAERFDTLVERVLSGTPAQAAPGGEYAALAALVEGVRAAPKPTPRADFAGELRAALMTEADLVLRQIGAERTLPGVVRPVRHRGRRRLVVAAGAATIVGATTSVALAAQSALPGDALYPVKRALESAQVGLTTGDGRSGELLASATERLDEVGSLAGSGSAESLALVAQTLADFEDQAREGGNRALRSGDTAQISSLRDFNAASLEQLTALRTELSAEYADSLAPAALLVARLDARAAEACLSCGGDVLGLPPIFLTQPDLPVPDPGSGGTGPFVPGGTGGDTGGVGPAGTPSASPSSGPDRPDDDGGASGSGGQPGGGGDDRDPLVVLPSDLDDPDDDLPADGPTTLPPGPPTVDPPAIDTGETDDDEDGDSGDGDSEDGDSEDGDFDGDGDSDSDGDSDGDGRGSQGRGDGNGRGNDDDPGVGRDGDSDEDDVEDAVQDDWDAGLTETVDSATGLLAP